jgi:hypothetical protein
VSRAWRASIPLASCAPPAPKRQRRRIGRRCGSAVLAAVLRAERRGAPLRPEQPRYVFCSPEAQRPIGFEGATLRRRPLSSDHDLLPQASLPHKRAYRTAHSAGGRPGDMLARWVHIAGGRQSSFRQRKRPTLSQRRSRAQTSFGKEKGPPSVGLAALSG